MVWIRDRNKSWAPDGAYTTMSGKGSQRRFRMDSGAGNLTSLGGLSGGGVTTPGGLAPTFGSDLSKIRESLGDARDQRRDRYDTQMGLLDRIDRSFADREPFYADLERAVERRGRRDLDERHRDATRRDRFGLLRRGVLGGSADVTTQRRRGEAYDDDLMQIRAGARSASRGARDYDRGLRSMLRGAVFGLPSFDLPIFQPGSYRRTDYGAFDRGRTNELLQILTPILKGRYYQNPRMPQTPSGRV